MAGQETVVVGSDGSWRSAAVVDVAAHEASVRGARLAVVSVVREVADPRYSLTAVLRDEERAADLADWRLREAVSRIRSRHPALEVTTHRLRDRDLGWPDEEAAGLAEASLLVVGARGGHSEPVFALGTVSRHLLKSTACPVLVVPDRVPGTGSRTPAPARPVVAAVGEALAVPVLQTARDVAALHGTPVLAVHAYRPRPEESDVVARVRAERFLAHVVAETGGVGPAPVRTGAVVRTFVTSGPVLEAIRQQAARAAMLVLGTRGPAALAGLAMESVSRAVLDDPPCPVLVLVPRAARRLPAASGTNDPRTEARRP